MYYICLMNRKSRHIVDRIYMTDEIINNPDGNEPALAILRAALDRGCHYSERNHHYRFGVYTGSWQEVAVFYQGKKEVFEND